MTSIDFFWLLLTFYWFLLTYTDSHTSYLSFFLHNRNLGLEILHLKVRKFATKVASRQNSINYHSKTQIMNCVKIMICILNRKSNYTMCKIARWVKHYTMCKIVHSVKNYTQSTFFHLPCGQFYTWLKTCTQPAVVMVVTNMRCANLLLSLSLSLSCAHFALSSEHNHSHFTDLRKLIIAIRFLQLLLIYSAIPFCTARASFTFQTKIADQITLAYNELSKLLRTLMEPCLMVLMNS